MLLVERNRAYRTYGSYRPYSRLADLGRDVHKRVHVRQDPEVPDEPRPEHPPEAPRLLLARLGVVVLVVVEGQVHLLHPADRLDDRHDLRPVLLPERGEDRLHHLLDKLLLVGGQLGIEDARSFFLGQPVEGDLPLLLPVVAQLGLRLGLLLGVQGIEQLHHLLGLVGEHVRGVVAVRGVAVVDRPAEGGAFFVVPVAADGQVVAGELEREFAVGRVAEDIGPAVAEGLRRVPGAGPGDLVPPLVVRCDGPDDPLEEFLLRLRVDGADGLVERLVRVDRLAGRVGQRLDDGLLLVFGQGGMEFLDQILGDGVDDAGHRPAFAASHLREQGGSAGGQCGPADGEGADEVAAVEAVAFRAGGGRGVLHRTTPADWREARRRREGGVLILPGPTGEWECYFGERSRVSGPMLRKPGSGRSRGSARLQSRFSLGRGPALDTSNGTKPTRFTTDSSANKKSPLSGSRNFGSAITERTSCPRLCHCSRSPPGNATGWPTAFQ